MLQYIIGYRYQGIFFAVHLAVFANHRQAVYVWVHNEGYIVTALRHQAHDVAEVLLKRFWIVLEIACRFTI